MQTFFVEIKCALGKTYEVASALAETEIASEIYSTAGHFDSSTSEKTLISAILLVKTSTKFTGLSIRIR